MTTTLIATIAALLFAACGYLVGYSRGEAAAHADVDRDRESL